MMDLSTARINFLGDSITFGSFASTTETSYVGLFAQSFPNAVIRNYGIGGSCISNGCIWNVESMCDRVSRMDPNADLIVVFGGTNDFGCCVELGTKDDRTEDTFYGACRILFQKIILKYPIQQIFVVTPLHRIQERSAVSPQGTPYAAPLSEYVVVLKEIASQFSLPVIDLYTQSQVQPLPEGKYMSDGIHPNDFGHKILFNEILTHLNQLKSQ